MTDAPYRGTHVSMFLRGSMCNFEEFYNKLQFLYNLDS
jgi:hypothetical protein